MILYMYVVISDWGKARAAGWQKQLLLKSCNFLASRELLMCLLYLAKLHASQITIVLEKFRRIRDVLMALQAHVFYQTTRVHGVITRLSISEVHLKLSFKLLNTHFHKQ